MDAAQEERPGEDKGPMKAGNQSQGQAEIKTAPAPDAPRIGSVPIPDVFTAVIVESLQIDTVPIEDVVPVPSPAPGEGAADLLSSHANAATERREARATQLIKGRIFDSDNRPVPNVRVTAYDYDAKNPDDRMGSAITDAEGRYEIAYTKTWWDYASYVPVSRRLPDIYIRAEVMDAMTGLWIDRGHSDTHFNHDPTQVLEVNLTIQKLLCPFISFDLKHDSQTCLPDEMTGAEQVFQFWMQGYAIGKILDQESFRRMIDRTRPLDVEMVVEIIRDGGASRDLPLRAWSVLPDLQNLRSFLAQQTLQALNGVRRYKHRIVLVLRASTSNGSKAKWTWCSSWIETAWQPKCNCFVRWPNNWCVSRPELEPVVEYEPAAVAAFFDAGTEDSCVIQARGVSLRGPMKDSPVSYVPLCGTNIIPVFDTPLEAVSGMAAPLGKLPKLTRVMAGFKSTTLAPPVKPYFAYIRTLELATSGLRSHRFVVMDAPAASPPAENLRVVFKATPSVVASSQTPFGRMSLGGETGSLSRTLQITNDTGHIEYFSSVGLVWCEHDADAEAFGLVHNHKFTLQSRWQDQRFKLAPGEKVEIDITGSGSDPMEALLGIVHWHGDVSTSQAMYVFIMYSADSSGDM